VLKSTKPPTATRCRSLFGVPSSRRPGSRWSMWQCAISSSPTSSSGSSQPTPDDVDVAACHKHLVKSSRVDGANPRHPCQHAQECRNPRVLVKDQHTMPIADAACFFTAIHAISASSELPWTSAAFTANRPSLTGPSEASNRPACCLEMSEQKARFPSKLC